MAHDYEDLLTRLATHDNILQKKVTVCNDKLDKLHTLLDQVANEEKGWTMEELTEELEQLDMLY